MTLATDSPVDVKNDDECYRCGYDLRGVADDQPCPECGLLAQRSRRPTDELFNTRPGWLRRLALGVWLILLAMGMAVLWPVVTAVGQDYVQAMVSRATSSTSLAYAIWLHSNWLGGDLAVLILIGGVLLLTGREGYPPADRADAWRRRWLRIASLAPLFALGFMHTSSQLTATAQPWGTPGSSYYSEPADEMPVITAFCFATLGTAPLPILLYLQLRSLAKRARSAHLAEHCVIVGIGNALTLVYVAAFAFVFKYAEAWGLGTTWGSSGSASLLLTLLLALSSILFAMWNVYLLIRFAIAFAVASRKLRNAWNLADRSDPFANETPAFR